ncbi:transmembrane channel-like protein 3 isoform X2 [Apis laboriosa]|uniref:transmembrane channel-like protein 3 isoform X2 n=1 Tax=Apis laboriosa TaxID=183418 RepID=UPI001CC6DEAA|nr:transmembrane channel-like protein 3 isoform X2 [Apis laboriosa]
MNNLQEIIFNVRIFNEEKDNEDEYSASACEIMQRRSSSRWQNRRKRRPSSPFGIEAEGTLHRRSSAYTISSGETAISIEESGSQEQIFEKLKLHKEVLSGVKQQPWPLRRKIKLVRQAKSYVRRHEDVLQERLAQTRSTKDAIARVSLFATKKWQYCRREVVNLQTWLIPWEFRIKEIESHFGSAVASYFIFLRWLFWINLVMAIILVAFVAIPEMLTADETAAGKIMLEEEKIKSKNLLTLWEFEGILKYSPFFYGWYTNKDSQSGYRLPLAYFVTNLVVYIYSFLAILRKMAENSRLSKLSEKEDECAFSWKLFTGWDFMIGNPETAHNRTANIVLGFKEALLEEAEKEKDERNWKIILMRIFVNVSVIALLGLSAYVVVKIVARSSKEQSNWWRQNEITVVLSLITYLFPVFFEILGLLESYHPRKQLRLQLARILFLNMLNLYSLIFALFEKIDSMKQLKDQSFKNCTIKTYKPIKCDKNISKSQQFITLASLSLILANLTGTQYKKEIPETNYDNYDYVKTNESNEIIFPPLENTTEEVNFTTEIIENDNISATTIFIVLKNFTETSLIDSNEETNTTFMTSISFNESIIYSDETTEKIDYNISTTTDIDSNIIETFDVNSERDGVTEMEEHSTSLSTQDNYQHLIIKTLNTNIESATITNKFTEESISTEMFDNISIILESSTLGESVISLLEKDTRYVKCFEYVCMATEDTNTISSLKELDLKTRKKLCHSCWETVFGQELVKLTVMDLIIIIANTLTIDFIRAVFVRFMNGCWCWDLEKQFPQYGDFKIAENILHLVLNQGIIWMGMFFSPGLMVLNLFKLAILMYLRSWAVMTCNIPHEVVFRASRSNNFYFALLLIMLFLCVLPVGYAIVWVEPSLCCGPFSGYKKIYHVATKKLTDSLPDLIKRCLDYIASPGIVIPLIVLMILIIYYMISLTGSLREANNDLKIQLRHERTEERRKLFKIAKKREEMSDILKFKKMLPVLSKRSIIKKILKDDSEVIEIENASIEVHEDERKNSASELTDKFIEQDIILHDQTQHTFSESDNNEKEPVTNNRLIKVLHNSWELQSSDYAIIPEIRINEIKKKSENHFQTTSTKDHDI